MEVGSIVAERFVITARAASGGMASVYRGLDRQTGQAVAVKVLADEANDEGGRFAREVSVLATLTHPGVVRYVAHGAGGDGRRYLVMEWLDGQTLRERLRRGPMRFSDAVMLVRALASALGEAHQRGIVHRDIKPSNVLLPLEGSLSHAKLLDFGIAHLRGATRMATRTGMMLGTPGYMAPEQARGDPQIDARTDVFALGCLLYECVAGKPAFSGEHPMALLAKILFDDPPPLRSLRAETPEALETLVGRTLKKAREDRTANVGELIALLDGLGALGDENAPEIVRGPAITRGEQRLLSVVLAAAGEAGPAAATPIPIGDATERVSISDGTEGIGVPGALVTALREAVGPYGGHLEALADGSVAWTLAGTGVATDQAALAARCALALRELLPVAPMALVTGRALVEEAGSLGRVIDRAARLLYGPKNEDPSVRLDDTTAGLLDARFDVRADRAGLALFGQRDALQATRTLLGRPTPCVGRDRELSSLEALFDECADEPMARVVMVTAPPGIGKSRLRYEFLRRLAARARPMEVWVARGDVMKAGSPFGMLAPALRRAAGIVEGGILPRRKKLHARVLRHVRADDQARVTVFMGELLGVPFPDDEFAGLRAARADAQVMSDQIRRAFEDFVAAECDQHPVVLVLEDLHWGDLPTVRLVDGALRVLGDRPLLVLALARPEVHDIFPRAWAERRLEEIRLGPLTKRAAAELGKAVLGDEVGEETLKKMIELADGNAFFLEELIRAVHDGAVEKLPDTVLAMAQARLERLEPEARRVLRAASVYGAVFWRGGVEALVAADETAHVREWIDALVERELLSRRPDSEFENELELVFRHSLLREAAYSTLTADDRALGHRLAAEWLENNGETEAMLLAEHWERGGARERAATWYRKAAQQALEAHDLEAALTRASRAIECGAEEDLRGHIRLLQAEANLWLGQYAESERCSGEAIELLSYGRPPWLSAIGLACQAASKLEHVDRMAELAQKLLALMPAGGIPVEEASRESLLDLLTDATLEGVEAVAHDSTAEAALVVSMSRCASQLFLHGKLPLASQLIDRVRPLLTRFNHAPDVRAALVDACAVRSLYEGDLGGYLTQKEEVVQACNEAGQTRTEILQRVRLGYACLEIGAYDRAVRELEGALQQAGEMGLHQATALAQHNLGMALARTGSLADARRLEEAAVSAFHAQGDARLERASRIYLAEIVALAGDLAAARGELQSVVDDSPEPSPTRALALASLSQVRLKDGAHDEALALADEALALFAHFGGADEGESLFRLAHIEALLAAGRRDDALAELSIANDRLDARAKKIGDEKLRALFLDAVPENSRTRELARTLLPA